MVLDLQMSVSLLPYVGFVDGASHSTQNLASAAWEIYMPIDELISLHGICLRRATNNIVEYSAIIELLSESISLVFDA
jgi:ribonuclease HI